MRKRHVLKLNCSLKSKNEFEEGDLESSSVTILLSRLTLKTLLVRNIMRKSQLAQTDTEL